MARGSSAEPCKWSYLVVHEASISRHDEKRVQRLLPRTGSHVVH